MGNCRAVTVTGDRHRRPHRRETCLPRGIARLGLMRVSGRLWRAQAAAVTADAFPSTRGPCAGRPEFADGRLLSYTPTSSSRLILKMLGVGPENYEKGAVYLPAHN